MASVVSARSRVARIAVAVLIVAGVSSAFAPSVASTDDAVAAGSALRCDQNTLYGITSGGDMIEIDAATGSTVPVVSAAPATNALGVTFGGTSAWAFQSTGNTIVSYDPVAGVATPIVSPDPGGNQTAIRGAVNPVTNIYYYAGGGTSARLAAYDITNGVAIGQVGTITGLGGANGDMAFGTDGTLYLVDGDKVYQVGTVPATAGAVTLPASQIVTLPNGTNSPGIAYSSDGYLFLAASSSSATIYKINPSSGANVATITISTNQPIVDLATCNYANSLRGQVNVHSRAATTDQFTVTNTGNGISTGNATTTSGSTTGAQPGAAGPNLTVGGADYTVTLSAAGSTDLAKYSIGWSCLNRTTGVQAGSGTGAVATFTNPLTTTSEGSDVLCTFLTAVRPTATNDAYSTPANTARVVDAATGLLANDTGAAITVTSPGTPAHGAVSVAANGSLTYTPAAGFTGTDSFTYTVTDANGTTATATASITVNPVATPDSYSTGADTSLTISDLTANDIPSAMTVQSVTAPLHGTAVLNPDGTVTYTPAPGYTGADSFSYTAVDGQGLAATATVSLTVSATAVDDAETGSPNTPTVLRPLKNDTPSGGATFVASSLRIFDGRTSSWVSTVVVPKVGSWEVVGSELLFTPVADYDGTASMRYEITDSAGSTVTARASAFYPPTLALAYTNVERVGAGAWGFAIEALLVGLALVLVAGIRSRRNTGTGRHRALAS